MEPAVSRLAFKIARVTYPDWDCRGARRYFSLTITTPELQVEYRIGKSTWRGYDDKPLFVFSNLAQAVAMTRFSGTGNVVIIECRVWGTKMVPSILPSVPVDLRTVADVSRYWHLFYNQDEMDVGPGPENDAVDLMVRCRTGSWPVPLGTLAVRQVRCEKVVWVRWFDSHREQRFEWDEWEIERRGGLPWTMKY